MLSSPHFKPVAPLIIRGHAMKWARQSRVVHWKNSKYRVSFTVALVVKQSDHVSCLRPSKCVYASCDPASWFKAAELHATRLLVNGDWQEAWDLNISCFFPFLIFLSLVLLSLIFFFLSYIWTTSCTRAKLLKEHAATTLSKQNCFKRCGRQS